MQGNKSGRPAALSLGLAAALGAAGAWFLIEPDARAMVKDKAIAVGLMPGCDIKGNVSINSGERVYHVPGQKFYRETRIRPEYGERWFCTEQEARAAGWRKAGI